MAGSPERREDSSPWRLHGEECDSKVTERMKGPVFKDTQRSNKLRYLLFNIQGHMQILEIGAPFGPSCSPSPFLSNETLSSRRRERTHVMHGDRDSTTCALAMTAAWSCGTGDAPRGTGASVISPFAMTCTSRRGAPLGDMYVKQNDATALVERGSRSGHHALIHCSVVLLRGTELGGVKHVSALRCTECLGTAFLCKPRWAVS